MPKMTPSDHKRFWGKVKKTGDGGCWNWQGSKSSGYGVISLGGRAGRDWRAHRISWELCKCPIPDGLFVLHRCDNPPCVNPEHLFLGTQLMNMRDMTEKGRGRPGRLFGEQNASSKISREQAMAIRRARGSVRGVAKFFGIGKSQVSNIRRGAAWA